ncbi:SAVED domain-containing protein [bacterium]|nr:SAVED domain-containing protein [bacterium]MBU1614289.1 SAVED domain-containing protein [bacterium]
MIEEILKWIGHAGNIIGIIGAIFAFMAWLILHVQDKRLKEIVRQTPEMENFDDQVKYHSEIQTISPYAFCLSLLPDTRSVSIEKEVREFLKKKAAQTKNKKWNMPIEQLNFNGLGTHNIKEFIEELGKKRQWFVGKGATEIHLFVAGPVTAATLIGTVFDNWRPVKLYSQNINTREYEFWCHLAK